MKENQGIVAHATLIKILSDVMRKNGRNYEEIAIFQKDYCEANNIVIPDSFITEMNEDTSIDVKDEDFVCVSNYLKDKDRVCVIDIWENALNRKGKPLKYQSAKISQYILACNGWKRMKSNGRFGEYGLQKGFEKQ